MRILFFCLLSVFIIPVMAQYPMSESKSPTDTIWPGVSETAANYVLISDSLGGYVIGTDSYHDLCKGQQFKVDSGYIIEGAIYWFGAKTVVGDGTLKMTLWSMDSLEGTTMAGNNQPCPGTELASVTAALSTIDTSSNLENAYVVTFPAPVRVYNDYVIGFDMSGLLNDTLGLMSTANGEAGGLELVWEKWSINQTWHTMQASGWGFPALLDVDAMILPIVDLSTAGLTEVPEMNGLKCCVWPNPAKDVIHLNINSVQASSNCSLQFIDLQGKLIRSESIGALAAGSQTIDVDLNPMAPGTYYCIVSTATSKYALKLNVVK